MQDNQVLQVNQVRLALAEHLVLQGSLDPRDLRVLRVSPARLEE
jgi:hypothetical protein